MSRNGLYLILGALVVAVAVMGYKMYQDNRQPEGLQITVGKDGLEVKGK